MSSLSSMELSDPVTCALPIINRSNTTQDVQLSCATEQDLSDVVDLINKQVAYDSQDRIVVVPEKFRSSVVENLIHGRKLFLARVAGVLVGLKKLYVEHDYARVHEMMTAELRVNYDNLQAEGILDASCQFNRGIIDSIKYSYQPDDIYVYTGLDYTKPEYRACNINGRLYEYAFAAIKNEILEKAKNASRIHLMYGLVEQNGQCHGTQGRTPAIVKAFRAFLQKSGIQFPPASDIIFRSYKSYMPQFDPKSEELIPLPDSSSIKGSGCLLTYRIPYEAAHE